MSRYEVEFPEVLMVSTEHTQWWSQTRNSHNLCDCRFRKQSQCL